MEKKTKIVATIGPASEKKEILKKMIENGMNVARLNFSHSGYDWHRKVIRTIRELSRELKVPIGIIADLQGPRIRTNISNEVEIKKGEIVAVGDMAKKVKADFEKIIYLDYPGIIKDIKKGNEILIEDGLLKLKVTGKSATYLKAEVIFGGIVRNHKGVNMPDSELHFGAVTEKDQEDLKFALVERMDFIALSFVSNAKEIKNIRNRIKKIVKNNKYLPQIISKIERKEAIKNIDSIINVSDAIMVARGDLGIEINQADLPIVQKEIIDKCLRMTKPVIVATQMLDSMIRNPRPTRAEISDVSNAVIDHTDAIMLSGETAGGKYPIETVKIMREIAEKTEASPFDDLKHGFLSDKKLSVSAAIAQSAHELLKDSRSQALVVASISGFAAKMIARHRPEQDLLVVTNNIMTQNQLSLVWGVKSFNLPNCQTLDALINKSIAVLVKNKSLKRGDQVVIVAGKPGVKKEHMSLVKFEEVK